MEEGKGFDHQSRVDLMTAGAIGRLLPKLGEFLKQEHNLQTSTKGHIESLEIHLRRMENALPWAQQDQVDPQEEHNHCVNELRELAYDTEDIVDNLMLCMDEGKQEVTQPVINQDSFSRETLDNIKIRVENLAAWRAANFVPTATTGTVEPCLDDGFKQARHLVGNHKLKADLISRMSSSSQGLKIVSIFGAGGMGKTTLAKAVYENIKGNFQYRAFVSLGPHPDMKKALRDILIHLDKRRYSDLYMSILHEQQLIDELRHFLEDMRFLIVIDDIWDIPSWEVIKPALVDNDCGSRIITTSHIFDVAESSGEVFKLMPLTIDGSKQLLYAMLLCDRKGTITFDQLAEQSIEYILEKCGGVPFAIIMIASLLGSKPQEEWTEVYKSIGFGHQDDIVNIRKIIQFTYYDLPSHLKACLLYLSIFPDGHVIEKDLLVWRWVAEGLVHEDQDHGESVFKVGERYLYELVSRSMIQIVENEETGIRGCRAESMVFDWVRTMAKEENFVNASGDWYDHDEHQFCHIMAVHNKVLEEPHDPEGMWEQKLRSFNGTGCSISTRLMRRTFQALRVLSLESCELTGHSDGPEDLIEGSLYLRYLGLRGTGIENLPIGIGGLRYLQTLDLRDTYIRELPSSVTQLSKLKCLRCFAPRLQLPEWIGNLTLLEELRLGRVDTSPNFGKELSKLTELRVLHIVSRESFDGKWVEDLVESLSKLQNIEELGLFCDELGSDMMTCRHVIAPGGFPKMRHLRTNTCWVMYQPGAMPYLKSVELQVDVQAFNDANFGVHHFYKLSYLRLLEKAHVGINCWGAKIEEAEEAEAALRHAVESHPNRPRLILNRVGRCIDDKQISPLTGLRLSGVISGLHHSRVAPQVMPLELLRQITNDFSEEQTLGKGAFGTVYKGVLNGKEVAVKLLHSTSQRLKDEEEFMEEFENLTRVNHPNIIKLLGYCYETKRVAIEYEGKYVLADKIYTALCFEYMHNGSLRPHLSDESCGLDWQTRYKIIKGTCEGLNYLHDGLETPMYHLNLKPGNILLDKNMVPKIADFGLSKLVYDSETQATSSFLGTIGYCPPEYIERGYISSKFDIFSLGVVMIDIIAGPEGYWKAAEMPIQEFIDHVQENWRNRLLRQTIAGSTSVIYECHQVKRCIQIALDCITADRKQRPGIRDIITCLNEIENIGVYPSVDDKQIRSLGGLQGSLLPHRAAGVASNHSEYETGSRLPHRAAGATSNPHRAAGFVSNHFEYEIGSWLTPQAMPLNLLRQITNNFSERLGKGTFGTVYKGVLNNGEEVAVKLLHSMPERFEFEEEEFWKELENLRRLNHPNIVQLLGYCYGIEPECVEHKGRFVVADKITRALCLEYMHKTSLQGYLDDESVDWQKRYKIIMGTCEGLHYLHKGLENPMLHLDLKPGNILLDQNMVPKLADFGLSKLIYDSKTQIASKFIGTRRYCPPEHFKGLQFSRKFDIFSLGVVMIEIIAGPKGYDETADEMPSHEFLDHVQENWIKRIHQATTDCASPKCGCRQVKTCIEIALECIHPERMQRPNIEDILSRLNETEHNTEKSATTASSQNEKWHTLL